MTKGCDKLTPAWGTMRAVQCHTPPLTMQRSTEWTGVSINFIFIYLYFILEILVLLLLGWSPMVEGKLRVGTGSISLHVEAGSMTVGYCGNCRMAPF